jgi:hypothetical protein
MPELLTVDADQKSGLLLGVREQNRVQRKSNLSAVPGLGWWWWDDGDGWWGDCWDGDN